MSMREEQLWLRGGSWDFGWLVVGLLARRDDGKKPCDESIASGRTVKTDLIVALLVLLTWVPFPGLYLLCFTFTLLSVT